MADGHMDIRPAGASRAAGSRRGRRRADGAHEGLRARLDRLDVLLVAGSGGVGKTSVAAAIALDQAMRGRRVCVLTIDPARRLADAMGLDGLDDAEREVPLPAGAEAGGSLHAVMLDAKVAFDRLVAETASSEEEAEQVYENRVYDQLSRSTAGTQEYMALERLYELDRGGRYDLVVVDTPPAAHARELLDSPRRMLGFLEGRSLRWFLRPGAKASRLGLRAMGGSSGPVVGLLQKVTGAEMLRDTTEFFESMEGMYGTIVERIRVVERMFADEHTGFLVVTSPERDSAREAEDFWRLLQEERFGFVGTVVNRVEPDAGEQLADVDDLAALDGIDESLAIRVVAAQQDHAAIADRDAERIERLRHGTGGAPVAAVPRLPALSSDLDGLRDLAPYLD